MAADESACKPDSVRRARRAAGGHPSRAAVADSLHAVYPRARAGRPRTLAQLAAEPLPSDLAPGGVYRAARVTRGAGGLLHHRFTLAGPVGPVRRSALCGTVPRVAPGGCYPPPCPVESGLSSAGTAAPDGGRPTRPPGRLVRAPSVTRRATGAPPGRGRGSPRHRVWLWAPPGHRCGSGPPRHGRFGAALAGRVGQVGNRVVGAQRRDAVGPVVDLGERGRRQRHAEDGPRRGVEQPGRPGP